MFWNKFFWPSVIVMLIVVFLHWVASIYGLYWSIWWYDIPMHFLGGLWSLLFTLWIFSTDYLKGVRRFVSTRNVLIIVFFIGFLWEVHEIVLGFTDISDFEYWADTRIDFVMDMLGAVLGVLIYKKDIRNKLN